MLSHGRYVAIMKKRGKNRWISLGIVVYSFFIINYRFYGSDTTYINKVDSVLMEMCLKYGL